MYESIFLTKCRILKLWYNLEEKHTTTGFVLGPVVLLVLILLLVRSGRPPAALTASEMPSDSSIKIFVAVPTNSICPLRVYVCM
jgi:hypothetical protein